MKTLGSSSRANPLWLLWLILGLALAFIACVAAMFFWMLRPVQLQERDVYGVWVSDRRPATTLEFKRDGTVMISGAPLPFDLHFSDCPSNGEHEWVFIPGEDPSVSVGNPCGRTLRAANAMLTTVLVISTGSGDPDAPEGSIRFTRTSSVSPPRTTPLPTP